MRLSAVQRFLTGATLAIFGFAILLGFQYVANQGAKADLTGRLATLSQTARRIAATNAASDANNPFLTTPAFPKNPPILQLTDVVVRTAAANQLATTDLHSSSGAPETIGKDTYRTVKLDVTLHGRLDRILTFFDQVEQGGLHSIVFDNMSLDPDGNNWTVKVEVTAYGQPQ